MKRLLQWQFGNRWMLSQHVVTTYRILVISLCLLHVFAVVPSIANKCFPGSNTGGWTVPGGDIVLAEGNTLEIYCVLDSTNDEVKDKSADHIVFLRGDEFIDSHYVTVVNKTTAKLRMENLPILNDMFYCKLSNSDDFINYTNSYPLNSLESSRSFDIDQKSLKVVCLNNVAVGSQPREVENFTCISYDWSSLNCSWKPPENGIKTTYRIGYQTPTRSGGRFIYSCPNSDDVTYNKCSWTLNTIPSYRRTFEYLTFSIVGENRFGNKTQSIKIHHYAHVIPAAPQKLTTISKTSSSIYLKWSIGHLFVFDKGFLYKVKYTWEPSIPWKVNIFSQKELERDGEDIKLNVTDLKYPNTAYDFRIYMKSAVAANDTGWSDPASTVVKTKPCPPFTSPKTDIGSFEIHSDSPTWRIIHIYWQPLSLLQQNGDDFDYEIVAFEGDNEINLKPLVIKYSYAKFNITSNRHKFLITSVNGEGSAKPASEIVVPDRKEILQEPVVFNKIDYGNDVYELSWKPPIITEIKITNFTIFWCQTNKERPIQCDGFIDWIQVDSDTTKRNFTVVNSTVGHQFAISVNTETSSSGMVWASCTLQYDKVSKMKNVWVHKIGSTYIDIRWRLECSNRIEGIQGYQIFYCVTSPTDKTKCEEAEKKIEVPGDVTTVHGNITELRPYTNYKISASVFTRDNRAAPRSDDLYNRTLDGSPDVTGLKVEAINVTNTSAVIRWDSPNVTNGDLQYYELCYNNDKIKVINKTEAILTNLNSFSNYTVNVYACNVECSQPIGPIVLPTKIGVPGIVGKPTAKKINSSHVKVTWNPPQLLAGPNPIYDVLLKFDETDRNVTFETGDSEAVVPAPSCKNDKSQQSYTFLVRAKNVDHSQNLFGDWSPAYSIECMDAGMSTTWKIMVGISLFALLTSIFVFWGKKGIYKCQQMKKVEVTLPSNFTIPPLFSSNVKDTKYHVNWSDENAESDHLY